MPLPGACRRVLGRAHIPASLVVVLVHRSVRCLTMSTFPGRLGLLVEDGVEAGGVVTLDAAGALDEIVLRFSFQLTTGTDGRTVIAGPRYSPIDDNREFRWRAGIVQGRAAYATSAQFLVGCVALVVVVVADRRCAQTLLAYRQRSGQLRNERESIQSKVSPPVE